MTSHRINYRPAPVSPLRSCALLVAGTAIIIAAVGACTALALAYFGVLA